MLYMDILSSSSVGTAPSTESNLSLRVSIIFGKVTEGYPAIGAVISSARRHASEEELPLPSEAVDTFVSYFPKVPAQENMSAYRQASRRRGSNIQQSVGRQIRTRR